MGVGINQIAKMTENPFMSSLNICPEVRYIKGVGQVQYLPSAPHHHPISQLIRIDISCKDDVTVILLLGIVYFMGARRNSSILKFT